MDEEKQTTNTGGTRAKAESKSEGRSARSEKLKTEKTSSSGAKSKFGKSKKGENGSKLKKTGQGKRRIGLKVPIPTPPPPGSKNFHGHEFSESNDVSEDIRDNAGFTGVMVGANVYRWNARKPQCHIPDYAEHPEWVHKGDITKARYVSPEEMENIRGGRIGKAIETDGSSTPKHKTFYTRYVEHDASHDYSSLREGKKLTAEQMEEVSKNHGFHSSKVASANSETTTHKSYYSKYCAPEHELGSMKKGYSGKVWREGSEKLSIDEPEYYEGSNPKSLDNQKRMNQKRIMQKGSELRTANSIGNAAQSIGEKIEALIKKLSESVVMFAKDNPLVLILAGICSIGILSATGSASAFGFILTGVNNTVLSTSFTAEDGEIRKVEEDYRALESDLSSKMDSVEEDYPGYDEYRYTIAPINHNPYELAALLTVLYEDYTEAEVKDYLTTVLDGQYDFTTTEVVEIRTRTETRWHWVTRYREEERTGFRWENGRLVEYTYTVQVPYQALESYEVEVEYDYHILNVTLTGRSIDSYVLGLGLSDDQLLRYKLLLETKGNKEYLFE